MPLKNQKSKVFTITNLSETEGEIKVYGEITKWAWEELGETNALLFNEQLKNLKGVERITLRINSPGGSVFEAQTMYNSLKSFAKDNEIQVTTFIEGVAASAATFLALAGDSIKMGEGCLFMIHNPSTYASGMSDDLRKSADLLDKVKETILDIYMKKTNLSREELSQKMNDETWFSAKEALEAGFIDKIETFEDVENRIGEIINSACIKEFKNIEKITNLASEVKNKIKNEERRNEMPKTLQDLRNEYAELINEHEGEVLKNAAESDYIKNMIAESVENAVKTERERIKNLEKIAVSNEAQKTIVDKAKFEEPRDEKEVIYDLYNSQSNKAKEEIDNLEEEKKKAGLNNLGEVNEEDDKDGIDNIALGAFND